MCRAPPAAAAAGPTTRTLHLTLRCEALQLEGVRAPVAPSHAHRSTRVGASQHLPAAADHPCLCGVLHDDAAMHAAANNCLGCRRWCRHPVQLL